MDHQFRSAAFGGFNRQDVLDYLESYAQANQQQLQGLQDQLDEARQELDKAEAQKQELLAFQEQARELRTQLDEANSKIQELSQALEESQALARELDQRVARLEPDAMAYAAVKERSAGVELDAHRRAQNVLDEAGAQARLIRQQTYQWLGHMSQEYGALRRQLDATLSNAGAQLEQISQSLDKQDGAFDLLREAYAKTDPDRKPAPTPLAED